MPVATKSDAASKAEIEADAGVLRDIFNEVNLLANELQLTKETLPTAALMLLMIKQNRK